MERLGLLIDYEYCTGCHSCEVACQMEHELPPDRWGIKIAQIGPWSIGIDDAEFSFVPMPTKLCNLCAERTVRGERPTCVKHCMSKVISYGPVSELSKELEKKPTQVLFAVR